MRVQPSGEIVDRVLSEVRSPRRPTRIACLTEETVEVLYRLGASDLVVGVSRYAERPPEAAAKPRVCAFVKADYAAIEAVRPDLVLAFSDLQAEIAAECARRGLDVVVFNQRSVGEILGMVLAVGALVGLEDRARALVADLAAHVESVAARGRALARRPRVHAEEWDDPLRTPDPDDLPLTLLRYLQRGDGIVLITAATYVVINIIVDLSYAFLDPRIRLR